jgi:hypothetical protein
MQFHDTVPHELHRHVCCFFCLLLNLLQSAGFSVRFPRYYKNSPNGVLQRDLTKAWGLRIVFTISGSGRTRILFSFSPSLT